MKKNYDFSKAKKGVLHRPRAELQVPVYLDSDIQSELTSVKHNGDMSKLVNALLRGQMKSAKLLQKSKR